MEDKVVKVTPSLKSELRMHSKGGTFFFYDYEWGKIMCFNYALYEHIVLGKEIEVVLHKGRYWFLRNVIGALVLKTGIKKESHIRERVPVNEAERELYDKLVSDGWELTRRGWPDFACFKGDRFMVVEVKNKKDNRLRKRQKQVLDALSKSGVESYLWTPSSGFVRIVPSIETP